MTAEKTAKGQLVAKSVTIYGPESRYAYPTEQQQWFNIGKSDQKIVKTKMSYEMGTGLLKSQSDGNDQTTVYEYDAAGRLKKKHIRFEPIAMEKPSERLSITIIIIKPPVTLIR